MDSVPRPLPPTLAACDLDEQRNQIVFRNPIFNFLGWADGVKPKYLPIHPDTAAVIHQLFMVNVIVRTHSFIGIEDVAGAQSSGHTDSKTNAYLAECTQWMVDNKFKPAV